MSIVGRADNGQKLIMERERFSNEMVRQARQADLGEYLISIGVPLVREGRRWRHETHGSLYFTDNAFFWNSKDQKGNAIDFLTKHLADFGIPNLSFKEAMAELTGTALPSPPLAEKIKTPSKTFSIENLNLSADMERTIAYLCRTRKIDYAIVKRLIEHQYLLQEVVRYVDKTTGQPKELSNIIFPYYDEQQKIVGAEVTGTLTGTRYKGIKAGSAYGYGYAVNYGENPEYALFFESAVDLLSFIDLRTAAGKQMKNCKLVSMGGLKENVISHTLKGMGGSIQTVLCVDNDSAGRNFIKEVCDSTKNVRILQPDKGFKDWNEQLCAVKGS